MKTITEQANMVRKAMGLVEGNETFTTHNDDKSVVSAVNKADVPGSGDLVASYAKVVSVFGKPGKYWGSDKKSSVTWYIKFDDGSLAIIYDHQDGDVKNITKKVSVWGVGTEGGRRDFTVYRKVKKLLGASDWNSPGLFVKDPRLTGRDDD